MSLLKPDSANRFSLWVFLIISFTFVFVKVRQVDYDPFIKDSYALSWDNYGYYLHLPAALIYGDPGIEDRSWYDSLNKTYHAERPVYQTWEGHKNRLVNVYPVGWAIINLPFFLVGHAVAKLSDYPADGLSPPYQYAMIISALFYAMLGMWFLRKLLLRFFNDKIAALLLLLIAFGTNFYYYGSYDCNLAHNFLFALDTLIVLLTIRWHEKPEIKTALFIGLLIGLVTITRPSEIVWLLIPLFWNVGNWQLFKIKIRMLAVKWRDVFALTFGLIAVGSLQLFYWKFTTGNWFSNNHSEGFDFFHPFTWEVLFSYKKGWLLYTPMMVLAILGLLLLFRNNRKLFVPVFIFFLANLWFISSWECWWYAGSFGQRPFVQSYGLMAIPLGVFITSAFANKFLKYITAALLIFFVALNQFQVWQLNNSIIDLQRMTKEYYWKVFGKTELQPEWLNLLEIDRGNLPPLDEVMSAYTSKSMFKLDFEQKPDPIYSEDRICDTLGFQSHRSLKLDSNFAFGADWKMPYKEITNKDHVRIRISADVFLPSELLPDQHLLFVLVMNGRQQYGYMTADPAQPLQAGTWTHINADLVTPVILHRSDVVQIYAWNTGKNPMLIDDVEVVIYEPK